MSSQKCNKKDFYRYLHSKRKAREKVGLLKETCKKTEVSQAPETRRKVCSKKDLPLVEGDQLKEHLNKLEVHRTMGPDGIYPHMLRDLANVTARPLSIIFERSW